MRGNEWKIAWLNQASTPPRFQEGLEQSARAVERIQALAVEKKFGLLIVVCPYPEMMAENKLRNEYTEFWASFAKGNQIAFADLSPLFVEEGKSTAKVSQENFIPGDFHWNRPGSARVAERLEPIILKMMSAGQHSPR